MKQFTFAIFIILTLPACKPATEPAISARASHPDIQKTADSVIQHIQLTEQQFQRSGITTAAAQARPISRILKVNGTVEAPPENRHTISFPLGGYLTMNNLIPGMYVRKGALLTTIEDVAFIQLQQDYLLSKSRLEFLEADYYRQKELSSTQSNSQKAFQQAKAEYQGEKISSRALAEKLRLIGINPEKLTENNISRTVNIYSPIGGYISKVNANAGKYVAPTDVLFELIDPSDVHISLTVFENDAASVKRGQKIQFTTNIHAGKKLRATIHLITPDLNESRAVEVHCDPDQPVPGLLPGSFVNAEIQLGEQSGSTLPDDAIVKWQNNHFIFLEQDVRHYRMVPVEVGSSIDGFTEIKSAIHQDSKVVITNAYTLLTMMKNAPEQD